MPALPPKMSKGKIVLEDANMDTNQRKVMWSGEVVSVQYISANGQVSNEPFSGINLVKKTFEDGSVETSKVVF